MSGAIGSSHGCWYKPAMSIAPRIVVVALLAALLGSPAIASTTGARTLDVPILMYHRIDYLRPTLPAITRRLTVDPGDFARQMGWLKAHGYHSLTQEQLLAALRDGRPLPARPVVITFDDGYRDVLGKASPVIRRLGLHATEYVITGRLRGTDPSFLTAPELRVIEQRGIEIGSHTVTHADLPTLTDAQAFEELTASKRTLEQAVGHPVPWFAYPYGAYDSRVVQMVARAGYKLAVTTKPGTCQSSTRPLELERLEVLDSTGVGGFAALLRGARC
jgi:peptidoglycan/xylan/chitin deacetylase (PgdA/CDA1 family)